MSPHDSHGHDHDDHDDHDHDHDHAKGMAHGAAHHHAHTHPAEHDGPVSEYEVLERAVRALLVEKGIITEAEVHAQIDLMDSRNPSLGAKIIAKAWREPAFKARLLADCRATLGELGIDIGAIAEFKVVENTPKVHNVIVCTLCSCYPKMLLGIPPAWYKSAPYRARTVVDPRGVLAEFGLKIPKNVEVRVHDSTADLRYIVLPMQPDGTQGWSEEKLAGLVGRDSMIGTALPRMPDDKKTTKKKAA